MVEIEHALLEALYWGEDGRETDGLLARGTSVPRMRCKSGDDWDRSLVGLVKGQWTADGIWENHHCWC